MKWIQAIEYDTVAANSSPAVGAVALIARHKNCQVLKHPCRHHIYDLFGKNIVVVVSGRRSSGPRAPLFLRYAREWPNIVDNIDYGNLKRFNLRPHLGTFIEEVVVSVRNWVRHAYLTEVFSRGDYEDLVKLIIAYLGAEPPGFVF